MTCPKNVQFYPGFYSTVSWLPTFHRFENFNNNGRGWILQRVSRTLWAKNGKLLQQIMLKAFFKKKIIIRQTLLGPLRSKLKKNVDFSLWGKQYIVPRKWIFLQRFSSLCSGWNFCTDICSRLVFAKLILQVFIRGWGFHYYLLHKYIIMHYINAVRKHKKLEEYISFSIQNKITKNTYFRLFQLLTFEMF